MSTTTLQSRKKEIIIHDYDTRIDHTMAMIRKELPTEDVTLIERYDKEMVRMSLAKPTRHKHLATILSLSRRLKKKWRDATKEDLEELVYEIMNQYSPDGKETNTTWDHKKVLKIFFRWIKSGSRDYKEVGDPVETRRIKIKRVSSKVVREQLITEEDLATLLRVCMNPRDKAFFDVHYEAGTRPSEILSLKIKNVKFDEYGAFIYVDGKTGPRPVRVIRSVPNLAKWIDAHPFAGDPEAPLWILTESTKFGHPLTYSAASGILKRAMKRGGINKKVNLKLFRHSEATNSARFMTEAQMRIRHGWSSSSKMPANYVHLVNADVDERYLEHFGIKTGKEEVVECPKVCHVCKTSNSIESTICNRCGKPLDIQKALEMEQKSRERDFNSNKLAAKILIQMLSTKKIPDISKEEMTSLVQSLNL